MAFISFGKMDKIQADLDPRLVGLWAGGGYTVGSGWGVLWTVYVASFCLYYL